MCRRFFLLFVCCCYTLTMNFEFESVVRGYHYYRKYWSPKEHEILNCYHEPGNPFDFFAIKTCSQGNQQSVGHLPREISRLTKFILDRGTEVKAKLTSNHYCSSPIIQGGLEIPCKVSIKMPATMLNRNMLKRYEAFFRRNLISRMKGKNFFRGNLISRMKGRFAKFSSREIF